MFEFHLLGKGGKYEELPLTSYCGKWLLDRDKQRVIDLRRGVVVGELGDAAQGVCFKTRAYIYEKADGMVCVVISGKDEDLHLILNPQTGVIHSERVADVPSPDSWEFGGEVFRKRHYVATDEHDEECDLEIYVGERKVILANKKTKKVLADVTDACADFLDGAKDAETIMRGGGIEMTVKHPETQVAAHVISNGSQCGPHVVISFKQNRFFWTGVQGELWMVYHNLETSETKKVVEPIAHLTEAENTVSVRSVRSNGAVLISTNGSYFTKDLLLYHPTDGLKLLLGKNDRFQGCQRARQIPHPEEIQLLHHSKAGAHLIRFDNDGNELERRKLDIPYVHNLSKEQWLGTVDVFQDYYYFNDAKESGVAVHSKTLKHVSYPSPKFSRFWIRKTGWFFAEQRGRDYLGYLTMGNKPPAEFEAVCKLLGVTSKNISKPTAKPKNAERDDFLHSLKAIDFFKGYPDKLREKIEARLLRSRKSHIIDKLELTGIVLRDGYIDGDRLSSLFRGTPSGISSVLFSLPGYAAEGCKVDVDEENKRMNLWYIRGAKVLEVRDMDWDDHIEELLAFCDLVFATYKMPVKTYFVNKDDKFCIVCTQPEAMESLRVAHDLEVYAALRVIST